MPTIRNIDQRCQTRMYERTLIRTLIETHVNSSWYTRRTENMPYLKCPGVHKQAYKIKTIAEHSRVSFYLHFYTNIKKLDSYDVLSLYVCMVECERGYTLAVFLCFGGHACVFAFILLSIWKGLPKCLFEMCVSFVREILDNIHLQLSGIDQLQVRKCLWLLRTCLNLNVIKSTGPLSSLCLAVHQTSSDSHYFMSPTLRRFSYVYLLLIILCLKGYCQIIEQMNFH